MRHRDPAGSPGVRGHRDGVPGEAGARGGHCAPSTRSHRSGRSVLGRRAREPFRRRARTTPLRGLHEHARRCCSPRSVRWVPRRRRGLWPGSTPRWRPARSSCRGHRSSASGSSRSAAATRSMGGPDALGGRLLARTSRARARASRRCTGPTRARSVTWAPAGRSASPTRRPASPSASCATTSRTRRSRSWAHAWSTCCTRRLGTGRGRRCTQLNRRVQHPDEPALIMAPSGRVVTWADYEAGANQVAHVLRDAGLRKGDHMAIFMENDPRPCSSRRRARNAPACTTRRSTRTSRPRRSRTSSTTPGRRWS